jgi:hypothetical protein
MIRKALFLASMCFFSSYVQAFNASSCLRDMRDVGAYGLAFGGVLSLADHAVNGGDVPSARTKAFLIGLPIASAAFAFVMDTPCDTDNYALSNKSRLIPYVSANDDMGIYFYKRF